MKVLVHMPNRGNFLKPFESLTAHQALRSQFTLSPRALPFVVIARGLGGNFEALGLEVRV